MTNEPSQELEEDLQNMDINLESKKSIKKGFDNWNNNLEAMLDKKNQELESKLGSKMKKWLITFVS